MPSWFHHDPCLQVSVLWSLRALVLLAGPFSGSGGLLLLSESGVLWDPVSEEGPPGSWEIGEVQVRRTLFPMPTSTPLAPIP